MEIVDEKVILTHTAYYQRIIYTKRKTNGVVEREIQY